MRSASQPQGGLVEGQTLAGKYLLLRQLGAGGMCFVFEAEHVHLRQPVAVKLLKPELASDRDCVARFEREARAAAQLRSPNVARVHDVDWTEAGQPYITMELLVGRDLGTELQERRRLPISLAVDYVRQAASGISEAHALGIVHRDLKPENLFLTDLGALTDRRLVKILDFGIAKNVSDSARKLTAPDAVFGTVDYMSPEQIRSASTVDHRTDIWSLGVILYELLTGRTPFRGDARSVIAQIVTDPVPPPSALVPELPAPLVGVVMKALAKDPAARFQSAEELREALEPFVDLEAITSVMAKLPPQSVPRRQSTPIHTESGRDARTNVSWETTAPRGWSKRWLVVPFTALCVTTGAWLILEMRGESLLDYYRAATSGASSAPRSPTASAPTAPPPPPAELAPPPPGPALVESAAPPPEPAAPPPVASAASPPASASAAPTRARPVRTKPAPRPAPAATGGAQPRLPRHL